MRLALALIWFLERICERLGLTDGTIWVKRHASHVSQIDVTDDSIIFPGDSPPAPPQVLRGTAGHPRVFYPQVYHPKMVKWLLWMRLRRLLKHCNLPFGPIIFRLRKGKIVEIHPIDIFKPGKDSIGKLAKWFSNDPSENSPPELPS